MGFSTTEKRITIDCLEKTMPILIRLHRIAVGLKCVWPIYGINEMIGSIKKRVRTWCHSVQVWRHNLDWWWRRRQYLVCRSCSLQTRKPSTVVRHCNNEVFHVISRWRKRCDEKNIINISREVDKTRRGSYDELQRIIHFTNVVVKPNVWLWQTWRT